MTIHIRLKTGMLTASVDFVRSLKLIALVAAAIFLTFRCSFGALGETEDQCNQRYGVGTVTRFDQQSRTKSVRYGHAFSADVDVHFQDGQATWVCYSGHYPNTMGPSDIPQILDAESQEHKWTLTHSNGQIAHEWVRDDGVQASEYLDPNASSDPKTFLTISAPSKPEPKKVDQTFVQMLGQAVLIAVAVGAGFYIVMKLVVIGLDALAKFSPKQ